MPQEIIRGRAAQQAFLAKQERPDAFQRRVIELATANGWMVHHVRPARTAKGWRTPVEGDAGFPDLTLARERDGVSTLILAEVKGATGYPRPAQRVWLAVLGKVPGVLVRVWRPQDWDEIERTLQ